MNEFLNKWIFEWIFERINEWMNVQIKAQMNESKNEWMNESSNEQMNEWKFKWMNEWMKVQMNKWMNEWTNVWSLIWNDYKHIDNIQMFNDKEYANIWKWKVHSLFSTMIQVYADMFHLPTTYTNHQIWNLQNARLNTLYSHTYYVQFFFYIYLVSTIVSTFFHRVHSLY